MVEKYKTITEIPGWMDILTNDGVPNSNATLYGLVPYLYRVIQVRCDSLSSIPIALYKGNDEGEKEWPYPTQLSDLIWKWEASLLLQGAAYGEIVTNKTGYKKDVHYRNPYDMTVRYVNGVLSFKQGTGGGTWENDLSAGNYEMLYFNEFDPTQDILPGVSSSKVANIDVKLLYALSKFPEVYFEGGAMPVTLLGIDTTDKGEIARVENWFKRSVTTVKNAFRVLGIRAGSITATNLTPPLKDMAMPEIGAEAKHNISVAFGVPKTMLDSEAANYATAVEDRKSFYTETLKPRAKKIESVINEQLLAPDNMRMEFKFNELELFQDDESDRASMLLSLRQAGLPIDLAMDIAGYQLSDEQAVMLQEQIVIDEIDKADDPVTVELQKWARMAEKRVKDGKAIREFETEIIPPSLHGAITGALEMAKTVNDIRGIFTDAENWRGYP